MSGKVEKFDTRPLVLSVVGYSGSGKTRLLERLITLFRAKGYRVGAVKHTDKVIPPDQPGKDTEKFRQAGADGVVLVCQDRLTFWMTGEHHASIYIMERIGPLFFSDHDLILIEGFKKGNHPKILVLSPGREEDLLGEVEGEIVATVGDFSLRKAWFHASPSEPEKLVEWLEERYLKHLKKSRVRVLLDGKSLRLNPFVQEILSRGIKGMLSPLKGYGNSGIIEIKITETDS